MSKQDTVEKNKAAIDELTTLLGYFMNKMSRDYKVPTNSETMAVLAGNFQVFLLETGVFVNDTDTSK